MTVGERIYYCRTEIHMTQRQLAEKTGIDQSTIGKYERGILNPKIGTLRKIADALGCDVADLDDSLTAGAEKMMDVVRQTIESQIDVKELGNNLMMAAYGTTDKNEAFTVVFSRWYKTLDAAEKDSVFDAVKYLQKLNSDGKQVAAERVEELAQIPKYQRPTDSPQNAPAGSDDKEPTEK